jgi:hypothetical protein
MIAPVPDGLLDDRDGDAVLLLNILSLVLSLFALTISVLLAIQQLRIMRQSNLLPVVAELFHKMSSRELAEHLHYINTTLRLECDSQSGYSNLSEPAGTHVRSISFFYDRLGMLVAHRVVNERFAISAFGTHCDRTWRLLEPFVYGERRLRGRSTGFQVYFEDLVCRIRTNPPPVVISRIGLRRLRSSPNQGSYTPDQLAAAWHRDAEEWQQTMSSPNDQPRKPDEAPENNSPS